MIASANQSITSPLSLVRVLFTATESRHEGKTNMFVSERSCCSSYVPYTVTKPHARAGDVTQNEWCRHSSRIASPRKGYTKWLGLPFKSHSLSAYHSSSAFYCDRTTCTSRRFYKMIGSTSQSIKSPYSPVRVLFTATEPRHEGKTNMFVDERSWCSSYVPYTVTKPHAP